MEAGAVGSVTRGRKVTWLGHTLGEDGWRQEARPRGRGSGGGQWGQSFSLEEKKPAGGWLGHSVQEHAPPSRTLQTVHVMFVYFPHRSRPRGTRRGRERSMRAWEGSELPHVRTKGRRKARAQPPGPRRLKDGTHSLSWASLFSDDGFSLLPLTPAAPRGSSAIHGLSLPLSPCLSLHLLPGPAPHPCPGSRPASGPLGAATLQAPRADPPPPRLQRHGVPTSSSPFYPHPSNLSSSSHPYG